MVQMNQKLKHWLMMNCFMHFSTIFPTVCIKINIILLAIFPVQKQHTSYALGKNMALIVG